MHETQKVVLSSSTKIGEGGAIVKVTGGNKYINYFLLVMQMAENLKP